MKLRPLVFLGLVSCSLAANADGPPIRPGLWEFAMSGMPHKQNICLKPDMVKDIKALGQRNEAGSDCKSFDQRTVGTVQSYKVSCTKPNKYDATVTMTVTNEDNFSMQQDYNFEKNGKTQKGSMKVNYKRLGDC